MSIYLISDLPVLVIIISVLRAWNLLQRSLFSRVTWTPLPTGAIWEGEGGLSFGRSILGPNIVRSRFLSIVSEMGIIL